MKIYIDYVFLINTLFDFILLTGISIILKRNIKIKRIIIGSIYGGLTIFILFLNISPLLFFILKMLLGIIMTIITFNYKDIRYTLNNFLYLIILSIIQGGTLYLINIEQNYKHIGAIFIKKSSSTNILLLLLISSITLLIYIKTQKKYEKEINTKYKVDLYINKKVYKLNGFLDTGNNLKDPYFKKPILIINNNIKINNEKYILVPYYTLNNKGLLKCYKCEKIYIHGIGYKNNILITSSNDKIMLSGIDIILHKDLLED